jgi:hypothetical protein
VTATFPALIAHRILRNGWTVEVHPVTSGTVAITHADGWTPALWFHTEARAHDYAATITAADPDTGSPAGTVTLRTCTSGYVTVIFDRDGRPGLFRWFPNSPEAIDAAYKVVG